MPVIKANPAQQISPQFPVKQASPSRFVGLVLSVSEKKRENDQIQSYQDHVFSKYSVSSNYHPFSRITVRSENWYLKVMNEHHDPKFTSCCSYCSVKYTQHPSDSPVSRYKKTRCSSYHKEGAKPFGCLLYCLVTKISSKTKSKQNPPQTHCISSY